MWSSQFKGKSKKAVCFENRLSRLETMRARVKFESFGKFHIMKWKLPSNYTNKTPRQIWISTCQLALTEARCKLETQSNMNRQSKPRALDEMPGSKFCLRNQVWAAGINQANEEQKPVRGFVLFKLLFFVLFMWPHLQIVCTLPEQQQVTKTSEQRNKTVIP